MRRFEQPYIGDASVGCSSGRNGNPPNREDSEDGALARHATLLLVTLGAIAIVGLLAAATAPVGLLVGDTQWQYISAFHGLGATVFMIGATISVYLAWRLYVGEIRAFKDLKWLVTFSAIMSAVTISFGTWIYIAYRASDGPRTYFIENLPAVHDGVAVVL